MRCRSVISSQHGGCVIIPREDGYIRLVVTEIGRDHVRKADSRHTQALYPA